MCSQQLDQVAASHAEETDELAIYVQSSGWPGGFVKALSKKPRPLESVILDQNLGVLQVSKDMFVRTR